MVLIIITTSCDFNAKINWKPKKYVIHNMHRLIFSDITEIEIFQGLSNISFTLLRYIELDNVSQAINIIFERFAKKFTIFRKILFADKM